MAQVLVAYQARLLNGHKNYRARACGRRRADGMWEGWLEFRPDDGTAVIRTRRETTQPHLVDLHDWATGLTSVHLDAALRRATSPPQRTSLESTRASAADGPASAVLDPFSIYAAKGEDLLRRQLRTLSPRHLRGIILAYRLAPSPDVDLRALSHAELSTLIVSTTRARSSW
jgi:hypothetical protein